MRLLRAMLVLCAVLLVSAPVWCAPVRVREAVLYVSAPAEVVAAAGAGFDLPNALVANSVQASQGGTALSVVLQPIYAPAKGKARKELLRYQARVAGAKAGAPVQVRFRTGGLSWSPTMSLQFAQEKAHLQVQASLSNTALDLTGATLRLMSGHVAGARETLPRGPDLEWYEEMLSEYGRGEPTQGSLQAVRELPAPALPVGGRRQVPLLSADLAVTRTYRWDTYPSPREQPTPQAERAEALYTFTNSTGQALPEGRVQVSEGPTAVGDGYLSWTPPGETAVVVVGSVRNLTVRRLDTSEPRPQTWETQRSSRLQVESTREEPVTVHIVAHPRKRWDEDYNENEEEPAYQFSMQPEVGKQGVFAWDLRVPAKGKAEISFSSAVPMDTSSLRLAHIIPNDSLQERQYIVESKQTLVRIVQEQPVRRVLADGYVIYRFQVPVNVPRADLLVWGGNSLRISLAADAGGKPGPFTVKADLAAVEGNYRADKLNYGMYAFDLSPFLGAAHTAYVRLDNPVGNDAFFAFMDVYRVPEGYPSRAHDYATGDAPASTMARRVLYSFRVGTPEEEKSLFINQGTGIYDGARAGFLNQRAVYAFTIPADVAGADLVLESWGTTAVALAKDAGGAPGEFHEELNVQKLLGRKVYDSDWQQYGFDLTPYLADNPTRTVYVAIHLADPTTGLGNTGWRRLEVTALDDAERARLARLRRQTELRAKEDRARHPLDIRTNTEAAAAYVYEDRGSQREPLGPVVDGKAEITYRLPLEPTYQGAKLVVWLLGDFQVSFALDDHGKPGPYTNVLRARDKYDRTKIEEHSYVPPVLIPIAKAMVDAGAVYVRIRDGAPDEKGAAQVHNLGVELP